VAESASSATESPTILSLAIFIESSEVAVRSQGHTASGLPRGIDPPNAKRGDARAMTKAGQSSDVASRHY
jgi:hypothetical protein